MLGAGKDTVRLNGNNQISFALSASVNKSSPLDPGEYDIWSDVNCFIGTYGGRDGGVLTTAPLLNADTGYLLRANNTISIRVETGDVIQAVTASETGTLRFVKTADIVSPSRLVSRVIMASVAVGALIAALGNSTVGGFSTNGGGGQVGNSWPTKLAQLLNDKGKKATAQNRFGCASGTLAQLLAMDGRVSASGAWSQSASLGPGGNAFGINSPAAPGSMTLALGVCNKIAVYWINNTAGRVMDYSVSDGPSGKLTTTGVYQIVRTEISPPIGQHSITFTQNTAHFVILGVEAYDDTSGMPTRIFNWGISGGTSTQLIDNTDVTAGRRASYTYFAPDLSIIEGAIINDWRAANISVATSKANLTTLVQTMKAVKGGTGKVILMTPVFDNGNLGNTANQEQYVTAMREVAVEQGVPLLDVRAAFRSYAYANAQGWMSDDVHPSAAGYDYIARLLIDVIEVT